MPIEIDDPETEALLVELARRTGDSLDTAILIAAQDLLIRLGAMTLDEPAEKTDDPLRQPVQ